MANKSQWAVLFSKGWNLKMAISNKSLLCKLSSRQGAYPPPPKTSMTMEHPPWMKMYFLLKMGTFQCHVSFQGCMPQITITNTSTGHGLDPFGLDAKVLGLGESLSKQNGGINSKTSYLQENPCSIQEPQSIL